MVAQFTRRVVAALAFASLAAPSMAQDAVADFYRGKNLRVIRSEEHTSEL